MTRWAVALACLAGCFSTSNNVAADGPGDPAVCKAALEAEIDRTCTTADDCVLVASGDCCGGVKLAVSRGTEATFPAAESRFESCLACPPLGCNHADQAEDGATPGAGQAIETACDAGRCRSVVR